MNEATFVFKTSSSPCECRKLTKAVVCLLSEYLADKHALQDLEMILTEATSNVSRHAYSGQAGQIEIRLKLSPGLGAVIEVADWGQGFCGQVRFDNPGPDSEGGRGMFLIRELSDYCRLRREGSENIVEIHKNIGKNLWKSCA